MGRGVVWTGQAVVRMGRGVMWTGQAVVRMGRLVVQTDRRGEGGPGQEAGAPGEAASEGGEQKPVAGPEGLAGSRVGEGERDGRGARVADGLDMGHAPLARETEVVCHRVQDPQIGLVGYEVVDVVDLPAEIGRAHV